MQDEAKSVQRSFRFSPSTVDLLDQEAAASGMSRNALAERLLGEALRVQHHPLVRFHQGAARRQPLLVGTRLYLHQVVATIRVSDGDLDEAAAYLGLTAAQVRAARDYYADFPAEVEADAAAAEQFERAERDRWERQQRALA
jgi:uncharacterized protein (DUF433 family)